MRSPPSLFHKQVDDVVHVTYTLTLLLPLEIEMPWSPQGSTTLISDDDDDDER